MKFNSTPLPGVIHIELDIFRDSRGYFLESYHQQKYAAAGITGSFVQDNISKSEKGTLRGLHAQALVESPSSFRRRGVFITSGALDRV